MKSFPILKKHEVALLFAEVSTGHIVDLDFNLVVNDVQEIYLVCNSFDDALAKVSSVLDQKNNIECIIYDSEKRVLKFIQP